MSDSRFADHSLGMFLGDRGGLLQYPPVAMSPQPKDKRTSSSRNLMTENYLFTKQNNEYCTIIIQMTLNSGWFNCLCILHIESQHQKITQNYFFLKCEFLPLKWSFVQIDRMLSSSSLQRKARLLTLYFYFNIKGTQNLTFLISATTQASLE